MQTHVRSLRKASGGMRAAQHKKKKREIGSMPSMTKIGGQKAVKIRTMGKNTKNKLLLAEFANVLDPKTKKCKKVKILDVVSNPAHHQYAKMKIINRGAVISTELGEARVTSRPGQVGSIDAVLVKAK